MTKELQDKVWNILPKEFKEEVKRIWNVEADCAIKYKSELHKHRTNLLYELFGDNLTSKVEGEEILIITRKKIQEKWQRAYEQEEKYSRAQESLIALSKLYYNRGIMSILDTLFGSKCLQDKNEQILSNIKKNEKDFNVDSLSKNSTENCNSENIISKKTRLEIVVKITNALLSNSNNEITGLTGDVIGNLAVSITNSILSKLEYKY